MHGKNKHDYVTDIHVALVKSYEHVYIVKEYKDKGWEHMDTVKGPVDTLKGHGSGHSVGPVWWPA